MVSEADAAEENLNRANLTQKKTFSNFLSYAWLQYRKSPVSIFLDGLVGGMLLSFLVDEEEKCHDTDFTRVFFGIGLLHFLSGMLSNMSDYSRKAAVIDNEESTLERKLALLLIFFQHLLKMLQFPALFLLSWFVIKIKFNVFRIWTHYEEEIRPVGANSDNCMVCYCEKNHLNLAIVVVSFQIIYGIATLLSWLAIWYIDSDDSAMELEEMKIWKEEEKRLQNTFWGKVKETALIIGLHPLFNESMGSMFVSLSVAAPLENSGIHFLEYHILEWFLFGGVISTLTRVFSRIIEGMESLALADGIISRKEHWLIISLKVAKLPLFLLEFFVFLAVLFITIKDYDIVIHDKHEAQNLGKVDLYCEEGLWRFTKTCAVIYSGILVLRIIIIVSVWVGLHKDEEKLH